MRIQLAVKQIRTVLIVDDEPVDRFIAEQTILGATQEEWKIVSFPGAMKALNFISFILAHGGTLPEVILLDLLMPDMDGLEFLETINRLYPQHRKTSRVIVLTFSEERQRWRQALALGAAEVMAKPLTREKWLAAREVKRTID